MKKVFLASVAGLTLLAAGAASAADLVVPAYKAPSAVAAPVPWTWTGFYLGGHVGGGWGAKEAIQAALPNPTQAGSPLGDVPTTGFLEGFQIGYNYQINWVVVGIDGDFSFSNLKAARVEDSTFVAGGVSVKSDWLATLTGRIGGTVDHALLYLKGGAAWTQDKFGFGCNSAFPCTATSVPDQTRIGWTVGAGVEYAFTANWSGKIEYDFIDFGTKTTGTFLCNGACASAFSFDLRQQVNTVKAGVNYRFDWGRG